MMRFAALLGASLIVAGSAHALPMPVPEPQPAVEDAPSVARDIVAETEHYCLTLALYFEGGSTHEPEIGLRHIARVITERAKADRPYWGGKTICGVVFHQSRALCQFSFACLPLARRTPRKNDMWKLSEEIAEDALSGRNEEPDGSIRYYMNARLSNPKYACRFRKEFVPVVDAGTHEFFREASSKERAELEKTNPPDCQRYEALLKKAKLKKKKKTRHAKKPQRKSYSSRTASR
jgi:hypothetical protein